MADFVLTLFPDGTALITTDQPLSQAMARGVKEMFEKWRETPNGVAVMSARVEHATSVELVLDAA